MIDSVAMLLDVLRRVQLFAPDQVVEVERELGPAYTDPAALAEYLVQIEWLTSFQFQLLFEGRWDELNIGHYTLVDRLGEGGVSEVFKAWDTNKGRLVALKVLRQNLATPSHAVCQFQRELEVVTRLNHPNIIKTFDAHQLGAVHYFAMEYVQGMDLQRCVELSGPLAVEQAVDYIRQASQGLQHAHQLGMVHRDIKPANLFLLNAPRTGNGPKDAQERVARPGPEPIVKIIDWGLARLVGTPAERPAQPIDTSASFVREKGQLIGSVDYIAPEQSRDAYVVDIRADIYSLGCTFFYLLTGRPPFVAASLMEKLLKHREEPAPPVQQLRPEVSDELGDVVAKMLAKNPEDRFSIPLLVVGALRRFTSGQSINGTGLRPGSAFNLARPSSSLSVIRPSSVTDLPRPSGSSAHGSDALGKNSFYRRG